jgi:hypothetical protein
MLMRLVVAASLAQRGKQPGSQRQQTFVRAYSARTSARKFWKAQSVALGLFALTIEEAQIVKEVGNDR